MTSEVIIDVQPKDISIALLEDKQLVEYQNERREASFRLATSISQESASLCLDLMPALSM